MQVEPASREDADDLAATFTAARRTAMPWLPKLHTEAEDRRYIEEEVIGPVSFQRNRRARAFYARHGFVELRLTDGADNEEREPDVLLAWRPADGPPKTSPA